MRTYHLTRDNEPQTDTVFFQYGPDHAWLVQGTSLGRAWVFVSAASLFKRLDKAVASDGISAWSGSDSYPNFNRILSTKPLFSFYLPFCVTLVKLYDPLTS